MISIVLTNPDHLKCAIRACRREFKCDDNIIFTSRGVIHVECNERYQRR